MLHYHAIVLVVVVNPICKDRALLPERHIYIQMLSLFQSTPHWTVFFTLLNDTAVHKVGGSLTLGVFWWLSDRVKVASGFHELGQYVNLFFCFNFTEVEIKRIQQILVDQLGTREA